MSAHEIESAHRHWKGTDMRKILMPVLAASITLAACAGVLAQTSGSETETSRTAITDYANLLMVAGLPDEAFRRYFGRDLIQHDPWIGDGNGGDQAFLEERREADPEQYDATEQYVNVVHNILADGDLVAIKSHVFTSAEDQGRIFVDIWRVENGQFVEHWDVIQPIDAERVSSGTVACGVGSTYAEAAMAGNTVLQPACGAPDASSDSAANRRIVRDYMELGQQPGMLIEAINTYVADDFTQHSARIPQGRQGLIDYMMPRLAARVADNRTSVFERVVADGDLVLVHRRVTSDSDPRGIAYIDLFRVRAGRITDHWDVVQQIPEFSVSGRSMTGGPDSVLEPGRYVGGPRGQH